MADYDVATHCQMCNARLNSEREQYDGLCLYCGRDMAMQAVTPDKRRIIELEGTVEKLEAELKIWRPMTNEEFEAALNEADAEPLDEQEIARILAKVTDPAYRPTEPQHVQMAAKIRQLESERDKLQRFVALCRERLPEIVCTEGEDAGVVLLDPLAPTHIEIVDGRPMQVYDLEYFSPLGEALMALWNALPAPEAE